MKRRLSHLYQLYLPVLLHDVLKGPQEVFLEAEISQLSFLKELHGKLPQRVHGENGHILIRVTAHLMGCKSHTEGSGVYRIHFVEQILLMDCD